MKKMMLPITGAVLATGVAAVALMTAPAASASQIVESTGSSVTRGIQQLEALGRVKYIDLVDACTGKATQRINFDDGHDVRLPDVG